MVRIRETHGGYDPLTYPLFFPHGEEGWRLGIRFRNADDDFVQVNDHEKTITIKQFYNYALQIRETYNVLHQGGPLFQQFVFDMFAKMEANRLNYIRNHQLEIRAELYQGIFSKI